MFGELNPASTKHHDLLAESDRTGGISRRGDEMMRVMLDRSPAHHEIAAGAFGEMVLVSRSGAMKIARHRGMKKAIVALARRFRPSSCTDLG